MSEVDAVRPGASSPDRAVPPAGYRDVDAFNDEAYADHWFEKHLADGAEVRADPPA